MKHTAQKVYISLITVSGIGEFPLDMLRYDCCVPESSEDASKIERMERGAREVRLRRYAANPGNPTVGRWNSFLWNVTSVTDTLGHRLDSF